MSEDPAKQNADIEALRAEVRDLRHKMVLQALNLDIPRYAEIFSRRDTALVEHGRAEHQQLLEHLSYLYVSMRYLIERGVIDRAEPAIRILFGRACDLVASVRTLLMEGYLGPAAIVARCLFETHIALELIRKDDFLGRCRLFENFVAVEKHGKLKDSKNISDADKARNLAAFELVKDNYHPNDPWRKSWAWKFAELASWKAKQTTPGKRHPNPNLRELCEFLDEGLEKPPFVLQYDDIYGHLSSPVHVGASYETWLRGGDGSISGGPKFTHMTRVIVELVEPFTLSLISGTLHSIGFSEHVGFMSHLFLALGLPEPKPEAGTTEQGQI